MSFFCSTDDNLTENVLPVSSLYVLQYLLISKYVDINKICRNKTLFGNVAGFKNHSTRRVFLDLSNGIISKHASIYSNIRHSVET